MNPFLAGLLALLFSSSLALAAGNISIDGNLQLNGGTATATAGAATLANKAGLVTSESLSTAAAGLYTLTITDTAVAATDLCLANAAYGTSTTGVPDVARVQPGAGSLVVVIQNIAASAALNGTIVIGFVCFK